MGGRGSQSSTAAGTSKRTPTDVGAQGLSRLQRARAISVLERMEEDMNNRLASNRHLRVWEVNDRIYAPVAIELIRSGRAWTLLNDRRMDIIISTVKKHQRKHPRRVGTMEEMIRTANSGWGRSQEYLEDSQKVGQAYSSLIGSGYSRDELLAVVHNENILRTGNVLR